MVSRARLELGQCIASGFSWSKTKQKRPYWQTMYDVVMDFKDMRWGNKDILREIGLDSLSLGWCEATDPSVVSEFSERTIEPQAGWWMIKHDGE